MFTDAIFKQLYENPKEQMVVAMEEFAELIQELSKQIRGDGDKEHLVEELVDAYIMHSQLMLIFEINPIEFFEKVQEKEKVVEQRIKELQKNKQKEEKVVEQKKEKIAKQREEKTDKQTTKKGKVFFIEDEDDLEDVLDEIFNIKDN